MIHRGSQRSLVGILFVLVSLVSACGGSPAGATPAVRSSPLAPTPTAASPKATATVASAPTAASLKSTATAAPARANQVQPCQLATAAEIQSSLGVSVSGDGTQAYGGCEWKLMNGARLHVQDYGTGGTQQFKMMVGALCGNANKSANQCTDVNGLGQQATFVETHGADTKDIIERSVVVRLSDDIVEVGQSNSDNGPPSSEDSLVKLAHIVVGRIP
jgi:hypothetical protein